MKKMFKRFLSLVLAIAMLLTTPVVAFAEEGTEAVPALPTAKVRKISTENLTFAMNFTVDEITDEQLAYYDDWYADFELTINKDVVFNADGTADGYLSGQYDEWSADWVDVPPSDVSLKANEPLKIMEYAAKVKDNKDLQYTYGEVYTGVQDFDCGVYFTPEFLEANPDVEVTLELRMYNPENPTEGYTIGDTYVYTVNDVIPNLPSATVTNLVMDNLTFATNFKVNEISDEQLAYYEDWYADFELSINRDVTFNSDGTADGYLSGQYDEWGPDWVNVPIDKDITLKAGEVVRIMEFASEIMGKPGLRYTFSQVYTGVQDFDCGIYFTPEFLAENPDVEVTLKLQMYNPENEDESYVIGKTYDYTRAVAQNTTTDVIYADITEALFEAAENETVVILQNVEFSVVTVPENVTLDLNGYTLTAKYVTCFGHIIDSSDDNTGLLKVAESKFLIQETNKQLPVKTDEGYSFFEVTKFNVRYLEESTKFVFQPFIEQSAHELIKNKKAASGVSINVRVTWTQSTGKRSQDFVYTYDKVEKYFDSYSVRNDVERYGQMFTLVMRGTEDFEDLTFSAVVTSNTGVELSSTPIVAGEELPVEKFEKASTANDSYTAGTVVKLGDLFAAMPGVTIDTANVQVTVSGVDATYIADASDWTQRTLAFNETGEATITITDNNLCIATTLKVNITNVKKFEKAYTVLTSYTTGSVVSIGDLFTAVEGATLPVVNETVQVTVTGDGVTGTFVADATDWTKGTVKLNGAGTAVISVTDNNYCETATITVEVVTIQKFEKADSAKDSYTSGTTVKLGDLFTAIEGITLNVDDSNVKIAVSGNGVTGTYTADTTDWTQGTLKFNGAGEATVTITDDNYCIETSILVQIQEVEKFEKVENAETSYTSGTELNIGDLFTATEDSTLEIDDSKVQVSITPADEESTVTGTYTADPSDWTKGSFKFNGMGKALITITDNNHCVTATFVVDVLPVEKFEVIESAEVVHNSGSEVAVGSLFAANEGATLPIDSKNVTVTITSATRSIGVSGVFIGDPSDWTKGIIKFTGVGKALVTITDNDCCVSVSVVVDVKPIEKFEKADTAKDSYTSGSKVSLGSLFEAIEGITVDVDSSSVQVAVEATEGDVTGAYTADTSDWTKGYVVFNGEGKATVTITDNNCCVETTIEVEILPLKKFEKSEYAKDSYTSGTKVTVDELFTEIDGITLGVAGANVQVTIEGDGIIGSYVANANDWTQGTVTFNGVGTATVTITDNDYCIATTLTVDILPVQKFESHGAILTSYTTGTTLYLGDLFVAKKDATLAIDDANVQVTVTPVGDSDVSIFYMPNANVWSEGLITFNGIGKATLTITDNNYCVDTTVTVEIVVLQKFEKADTALDTYSTGMLVNIGDLFTAIPDITLAIDDANVQVSVTPLDEGSTADGIFVADISDWTQGTLEFAGVGKAEVTITDDNYCVATTIIVEILPIVKFEKADTAEDSYTSGTTVNVGVLFAEIQGTTIDIDDANVQVAVTGDGVTGTYTSDANDWTMGTVKFNGTGTAVITITDNYDCVATTITVEIVPMEKFEKADTAKDSYTSGTTVNVGDLFAEIEGITLGVSDSSVNVTVAGDGVTGTYVADTSDWINGTVKFNGTGTATVTITDNDCCIATTISVEITTLKKFEKADTAKDSYTSGATVNVGDLFAEITGITLGVSDSSVNVTVAGDGVTGTYVADTTDWTQGTITFDGEGEAVITITDNDYCIATTITVTVEKPVPVDKFAVVLPNYKSYLYRVGNNNAVSIGRLFTLADDVTEDMLGNVTVEVKDSNGTVRATYAAGAGAWNSGTIAFTENYTGLAYITIKDDGNTNPLTLSVEVIDATNVVSNADITALKNGGTYITGNGVLLADINGAASFYLAGGNFYGNGFTLTYTGNGSVRKADLKQAFVNISEGALLENVRIVCKVFPEGYVYVSEFNSVENTPYQNNAVTANTGSRISNCYIYGARANIFINGDVTVENTVTESGSLANIQIDKCTDANTIKLNNVTTIQSLKSDGFGEGKTVMGFGVLVGTNESVTNPYIVIDGDFKQYNWVASSDASAISNQYASSAINAALGMSDYLHTVDGTTKANMGIIFLNTKDAAGHVTNNSGLPYKLSNISMKVSGISVSGQVYSLTNSSTIYSDVENADRGTVNGWYEPQFGFVSDLGGQKIPETDDCDEFLYVSDGTLKIMFVAGDSKEVDIKNLVSINKYTGQDLNLEISCKDDNGNNVAISDGKIVLSEKKDYVVTYKVTDTLFYDLNGEEVTNTLVYTWEVPVTVSLKDKSIPDAYFEFDSTVQKIYYSGLSSYTQFIPFLSGLKIYDYDTAGNAYLRFDGGNTSAVTDFNKIAKASIANNATSEASGNHIVTIELTDGGKLVVDLDVRATSGGSTHTGSIKVRNNVLYVVNDGTTGAKGQQWRIYSYKFIGNNGVEINSGAITFGTSGTDASSGTKPSSNFSVTINATVNFNANGGQCAQTIGYATSNSKTVTLPTPSRGGYIFAGWYTATSGGTRVGGAGDSYTPSGNITLYAQWGKPCTVTYNGNGGTVGTTSDTYTGVALILPSATNGNKVLSGWYTAPTGGNKVGGVGDSYVPSGDVTLYAQWQDPAVVTYNANGGSCSTSSATFTGAALTLPTPTMTGYKCTGWFTAASGGTKVGDAGGSYSPSANITLYAQWEKVAYTITYSKSEVSSSSGPATAYYGDTVTVTVTYSKGQDSVSVKGASSGTTIKVTSSGSGTNYTYTFTMPAENVTMTITGTSCVTADTLVTLADGTQVRVDSLTGNEELLVWNLETGKFDSAPIMFVDSDAESEYDVIHLYFSDGTDVKVIYEHGFWDYDLNKYVYLDANAAQYIGHTFAKHNGSELVKVQLTDVVLETEYTSAWSPVTVGHLCYFVNGMLSMPGGVGGLFNIFNVDAETMTYDYESIQKDIETYGLFTYEELNSIEPLSEEMFEAAGGAYLKISIGKGNMTMDDLVYMIRRYSRFI